MALIAAGPGGLRDALRAMLVSMLPDVMIIDADDTAMAEALLRTYHPDLVLIDGDLPGNVTMQLVETIQRERPRARCSILVDDVRQQAAALRAGADHAPLKVSHRRAFLPRSDNSSIFPAKSEHLRSISGG